MAKKLMSILTAIFIGNSAISQKSAEEYLNNAPINLRKEVCAYTKEEFEVFTDNLESYCETMREEIERRKQSSTIVELSSANYQKAMEILGKVTDYSTSYMSKYYCLTLLCKDYPELLSGDEISRATNFSNKFKDILQFRMDVTSGKAKESDRPGWRGEMQEAETGFCSIMGSKYKKVLENDLADLKKLLPDYQTMGSLYYSGGSGSEIEALSAVLNYLEKFRTNSFLGNLKMVFSDFTSSTSDYDREDDQSETSIESDHEYDFDGNYLIDLLKGTSSPEIGFKDFIPGIYTNFEAKTAKIIDGNKTVSLKGSYTDALSKNFKFEFSTIAVIEFEYESETGFELTEGNTLDLIVKINLPSIFAGVDFSKGVMNSDNVIIINETNNSEIFEIVKSNLRNMAEMEEGDHQGNEDED